MSVIFTDKLDEFFTEALAGRNVTTRPYAYTPGGIEPTTELSASTLVSDEDLALTTNGFWNHFALPLARMLSESIPQDANLAVPPVPSGAYLSGQAKYVRWLIDYDFEMASDRLTLSVYA